MLVSVRYRTDGNTLRHVVVPTAGGGAEAVAAPPPAPCTDKPQPCPSHAGRTYCPSLPKPNQCEQPMPHNPCPACPSPPPPSPPSAASWATAPSENVRDDLYSGEIWDGRIGANLTSIGFWSFGPVPAGLPSASALRNGRGINDSAIMSAQLLPPISVSRSYPAVSVSRVRGFGNDSSAVGWVFRFNQSMAGRATLRVHRSDFAQQPPTQCQWWQYGLNVSGTGRQQTRTIEPELQTVVAPHGCVSLRYGNLLEDDGTVMNQFGNITYDQSDIFILASGEEQQSYTPHFTYHGYQYVWVTGLGDKRPPLSMLTAHKTNSAVDHDNHGHVGTDNSVLNKIYHAAAMSTSDVLQSIGMDVPDRERLGWLGDTSQYSEAAMRIFDMTAFFENQLRNEVDQASIYGGYVGDICPGPFGGGGGDPAWQSALVGIAQHMYQESGDATIARRTFAAVSKQVELYLEGTNSTKRPHTVPGYGGFDFHGLLVQRGYGDYLNLACTCDIYGDSTKMGIIEQSNSACISSLASDSEV